MRKPNDAAWWLSLIVVVLIVVVWPPSDDRSLAVKLLNWAVDPQGVLPLLPDQLPLGQGDNPDAVNSHDALVQQYDALYLQGGWTRRRLELKVARDPFNPSTERQLLVGLGLVTALIAWRASSGG